MSEIRRTCCFSGHRKLPAAKKEDIQINLNHEISELIKQGVTNFISGGALGFDQMAASLVIEKKKAGANIRLILALPCKDQDARWNARQKEAYKGLLSEADEIVYLSEEYEPGCMKKRNDYMVEHAAFCICALLHERSGTGQTIRYARKKGLRVINIASTK